MKHLLFLSCLLICNFLFAQKSIYNINIKTFDSVDVKLSDFRGTKLLIASVSLEKLKSGSLNYLDSLQSANPKIKIFVIPADDFGGDDGNAIVDSIRKVNKLQTTIVSTDKVKKGNGDKQNKLMKWLTTADDNEHFDVDVTEDFQMYVINNGGQLYAVIKNQAEEKILNEIINQKD